LPLIEPLSVKGMTVKEIRQAIIEAYTTGPEPIVKPGRERVIATLVRPRQVRVLVMRQDSPAGGISLRRPGFVRSTREFRGGAERLIRGTSSGSGTIVSLPAYQNDVLTALALSGGLPGLDAANEILILRGYPGNGTEGQVVEPYLAGDMVVIPDGPESPDLARQITRIPLRWWPGEPPPFRPEEIVLNQGDIVYVKARDTDVYYTGGLLPSGEYPLPRDHDLTVTEAVAQVGGPLINGGLNSNNLSGAIVARGIGSPSPRLVTVVRKTRDGCQVPIIVDLFCALNDPNEDIVVMPGDLLIMQETKPQALARYFTDVFSFDFFGDIISRSNATGTIITTIP
jgi:protein involved in polysaccharide export with SLBB domain